MADNGTVIKIGIIGCGNVAEKRHIPAINSLKNAEVIAIADVDEDRLKRVGAKFQIKKQYVDYKELIVNQDIEAVGVCVPLKFHFEVALAVMKVKKHLLIEKPLAMSLDETDKLINLASKIDTKVMVGLNRRWHRLVREARDIIRRGSLGHISLINAVFSSAHNKQHIPEWRKRRIDGGRELN